MKRLLKEYINGNCLYIELGGTQVTTGQRGRQLGKGVNVKQRMEINRDLRLKAR